MPRVKETKINTSILFSQLALPPKLSGKPFPLVIYRRQRLQMGSLTVGCPWVRSSRTGSTDSRKEWQNSCCHGEETRERSEICDAATRIASDVGLMHSQWVLAGFGTFHYNEWKGIGLISIYFFYSVFKDGDNVYFMSVLSVHGSWTQQWWQYYLD